MSESFSNLLDESLSTLDMQPGSIVSGVVLDVDKDWVTVHVGLKSEGVISLDEFRNNNGETEIQVGDEIEVALEAVEDGYGETRISREKARKITTWKMLEEALETGEFVSGKIHNRLEVARGEPTLCGVVIETKENGLASSIKPIRMGGIINNIENL